MTYSSLLVHLTLGATNAAVLEVAAGLAERFEAEVIGIAGCQPAAVADANGYVSAEVINADFAEIQSEMKAAEAAFRTALSGRARSLEWRSAIAYTLMANYVAEEGRRADLILSASAGRAPIFEPSRQASVGDLVMRAGRPVLIVPETAPRELGNVLIGWKDTRETRRAIRDALPLLKKAGMVTVVEIAAEHELAEARTHVTDVTKWLEGHGVRAGAFALSSSGNDMLELAELASAKHVDLIVAGAYGHSRLSEWVFGGVTRSLLEYPPRCTLLSH